LRLQLLLLQLLRLLQLECLLLMSSHLLLWDAGTD
jgi:hypothetical protein